MNATHVLQSAAGEPIDRLLARLENVRQTGNSWRATCPAHGSDRNQTLSIATADDGRVLLHCFAGCTPLEILHAVGLELANLFPDRPQDNRTPKTLEERRAQKESIRFRTICRVLPGLAFECRVVLAAAGKLEHA